MTTNRDPLLLNILRKQRKLPIKVLGSLTNILRTTTRHQGTNLGTFISYYRSGRLLTRNHNVTRARRRKIMIAMSLRVTDRRTSITRSMMTINITHKIRLSFTNSVPIKSNTNTLRRRINGRNNKRILTNRMTMTNVITMSGRTHIKRTGLISRTTQRRTTLGTRLIRNTMTLKPRIPLNSKIESTRQGSRLMLPGRDTTIGIRTQALSSVMTINPLNGALSTFKSSRRIIIRRPRPLNTRIMNTFNTNKRTAYATTIFRL